MKPSNNDINSVLNQLEAQERGEEHPRSIARRLVQRHRRARAIDPDYRFEDAPLAARQVIYDMSVKYGAQHSLLARLRRK